MSRYRKILVAYDGSDSAQNALTAGAMLARQDKSWIKVLAVIPAYAGELELIGISNIKETITGPGQELLAEARQLADEEDVHVLTNLEQGEPFDRIVHVAADENCDLIVMGRCGRSHLERELMGSVTARVIGHTDRNVLVVPEKTSLCWDSLLLATDGSENSRAAFDLTLDIAAQRGSKVAAISVIYTNDEFGALAPEMHRQLAEQTHAMLDQLKAEAAGKSVILDTFVREGEPHQAITELATELGSTVIVTGTYGRKGISRLLMGSVTERTIGYAPCPVLVAH